jgi:hypothetical protein
MVNHLLEILITIKINKRTEMIIAYLISKTNRVSTLDVTGVESFHRSVCDETIDNHWTYGTIYVGF